MRVKWLRLQKKLFNHRRLVVLNDDTFEEIFSLKLNLMNVFIVITLSSIFLISITTYIIAFTPLREYIPGYTSTKLRQNAINLAVMSDSLDFEINKNQRYIRSIQDVLKGELEYAKLHKDSILQSDVIDHSTLRLEPSIHEKNLRQLIDEEDKFNVLESAPKKVEFVLFSPAKGIVVKSYNSANNQTHTEIKLPSNEPIKSISNGSIIFADWTASTGHVVIVRHMDGLTSVYKNLGSITNSKGDILRSGEVIGHMGEDLKNFQFELWKDGYLVNPEQFIDFE